MVLILTEVMAAVNRYLHDAFRDHCSYSFRWEDSTDKSQMVDQHIDRMSAQIRIPVFKFLNSLTFF